MNNFFIESWEFQKLMSHVTKPFCSGKHPFGRCQFLPGNHRQTIERPQDPVFGIWPRWRRLQLSKPHLSRHSTRSSSSQHVDAKVGKGKQILSASSTRRNNLVKLTTWSYNKTENLFWTVFAKLCAFTTQTTAFLYNAT